MKEKTCQIAINPEYDGYERRLADMVYKLFLKKTGSGTSVNEELAEELRKPVIKDNK